MTKELSYALITPYTIAKSRTGGVIARLLSRLDLELVGAQIFAPSKDMVEDYAASLEQEETTLLSEYVRKTFMPSGERRHRAMLLLFQGEDACKKLSDIVGALYAANRGVTSITGETIRDTYADMVYDSNGEIIYCEPAVLTPRNMKTAQRNMAIFATFIMEEANVVENVIHEEENIERTLVIIKPDNWKYPSSRPGSIIDMFSRTGLRLIACKEYQMSVDEALEFYKDVKEALVSKLGPLFGLRAKSVLQKEFNLPLSEEIEETLQMSFGREYALSKFDDIIEFMSGHRTYQGEKKNYKKGKPVKSMVLIYEGENAVEKIRTVLGPTDPTKAPGGTVRREFGSDIMVNTAHASDCVASAQREMKIVNIQHNNCASLIYTFLQGRDS